MRSVLTTATVLIVIAMLAFAQSVDPDLGTGNIAPLAATNQGGASAYAQAPDKYEIGYTRRRLLAGYIVPRIDLNTVRGDP